MGKLLLQEASATVSPGNHNVDAQDYRGETPLYVAARKGNAEIANLLLATGAQVTIRDDKMQMPLHASAAQGSVAVVKALLTNHAPVNAEDRYKKLSLHYAVANKHVGVIKLLLEAGADVNHQDLDGHSPLDIAQGDSSLVDLLLAWSNPLINSIKSGEEGKALSLIEKGANVNQADTNGKGPLHWASEGGWERIVEALLDKGASPGAQDNGGKRPLHDAVRENRAFIATQLLAGRTSLVDEKDKAGKPPYTLP